MANPNYRLLILDLDGTVLDNDGRLTPSTETALKKVQDRGLKATFATGRLFNDTLPYAKKLGLTLPLIVNHGAVLQTPAGEVLISWQLDRDQACALVAIARRTGCACQLYKRGQLYLERLAPWNKEYLKYSTVKPRIVPDLAAIAALKPEQIDFLGKPDELKPVANIIERELGPAVNPTSSCRHLLEVLPAGVSKGTTMEYLAAHLKIPLSATVAIGDGYNDLGLILAAGLGVAMGNAPEAVRRQADYVTAPNDQNGLALFLEHLLAGFTH
ncbi:MAG TPA: Cof-type HAD-IIB family hydrolase [bacterium]|jgi:Cof subfamily protein (haloacid dehalogenase superfamily)|nr:Cof-type HAD-IIB family hydrolase [bacterium]